VEVVGVPGDRERGEMAMRLVIGVMAVLAGLAWVVPMVFLGKAEVNHAADLTGASDKHVRTQAPADPIGKANDVSTQVTLQTAIQSAAAYFSESGTYVGFGDAQASAYDPSIHITTGAAKAGSISARGITATTIVLVAQDPAGQVLCVAANGATVSYGREDAQTALQCTGGW
jgi:hypothetical protein